MNDLIRFIEDAISQGKLIGVSAIKTESGSSQYIVDYWEVEKVTDDRGEEVEIKAGKQKTFTL